MQSLVHVKDVGICLNRNEKPLKGFKQGVSK